jgi:hypothetical protein
MLLDAEVKEDGTLVANIPPALWGKKIKIIIQEKMRENSRKKRSQWEQLSQQLQAIDALNLPPRDYTDIITDLRKLRETE